MAKESSTKRKIGIGCAVVAVIVGLPYCCAGVFNVMVNELTLTHGLTKDIEEMSHVREEFDMANDRKGLVEGRVVESRHMQFEHVLVGDDRVLDVRYGQGQFDDADISEARTLKPAQEHALLYMQLTCCMEQDHWYELFEIEEGTEKDAPEMLERIFGYDLPGDRAEVTLVHIDFGNIFDFSTRWMRFEQRCAGTWVVTGQGSSVGQSYDLDIDWVARDHDAMRRKKLGYALTVPADVVGWPVHLLMLFALAGVVV